MLTGWSYWKKITIDKIAAGATAMDIVDCVLLTSANFDFTLARSDGFDIRFTSSDGNTLLSYERVSYDSVAEIAELHIKVPIPDPLIDTVYYMYYGKADATDVSDPANVWDANFMMVQHMNDATTSTITDSTANNNDGVKKAANEPIEAAGSAGMAQDYDGSDDFISLGTSIQPDANDFTITLRLKNDLVATEYVYFDANANFVLGMGGAYGPIGVLFLNGWSNFRQSTGMTANEWNTLVFVKSGQTLHAYVNGALGDGGTAGTIPATMGALGILKLGYNGYSGLIDEARISYTARSDAWIKAEHNALNQTLHTMVDDPPTKISVGGTLTASGGLMVTNPDWIPIDDRLNWLGAWSATYVYTVGDVVMYKTSDGNYHGWLSRTTHNIGNIPTTSYAHWARIVQSKWKR